MNQTDQDPTSDPELEALGVRLRSESTYHTGDLDLLLRRAGQRSHRRRVVAASVALLVIVLGISAVVRAAALRDEVVGVANPGPGPAMSELPMWTVNPSIPVAQDVVWGVEVTYDPAVWDFQRLMDEPSLQQYATPDHAVPLGIASFHLDPKVQAYWGGDGAEQAALAAQRALQGRPGIVSVEVNRARATSRPPATGPLGTVTAG